MDIERVLDVIERAVEMENVFDKAPTRRSWDFPRVDVFRSYDDDGQGGNGVHTQSSIAVQVLPHQEEELIVILEEWMGQRI